MGWLRSMREWPDRVETLLGDWWDIGFTLFIDALWSRLPLLIATGLAVALAVAVRRWRQADHETEVGE